MIKITKTTNWACLWMKNESFKTILFPRTFWVSFGCCSCGMQMSVIDNKYSFSGQNGNNFCIYYKSQEMARPVLFYLKNFQIYSTCVTKNH